MSCSVHVQTTAPEPMDVIIKRLEPSYFKKKARALREQTQDMRMTLTTLETDLAETEKILSDRATDVNNDQAITSEDGQQVEASDSGSE